MKQTYKVFGAVALAALSLSFCRLGQKAEERAKEKIAEKIVEKSTGGKVDINGQKITVTDDKGQTTVLSGGAIPENFPKDMPIYPGATASGGYGVTGGADKSAAVVALQSPDGPVKVLGFYQAELPKNGWEIKTTVDSKEEGGMLLATKGTRQATITVGKGNDPGTASMVLTVAQGS